MKFTHKELVQRASKWLQNSAHCPVVLYEARGDYEIPDAIGWKAHGNQSIVIECKTSVSDFKKDQEKRSRKVKSMGNLRYYLAPKGLIKVEDLPENWGLLEIAEYNIRIVKKATLIQDINKREEMGLMYTALHRQCENIQRINEFLGSVWPLRGHFNGAVAMHDTKEIYNPEDWMQNLIEYNDERLEDNEITPI